jgi:hypothetical protein
MTGFKVGVCYDFITKGEGRVNKIYMSGCKKGGGLVERNGGD